MVIVGQGADVAGNAGNPAFVDPLAAIAAHHRQAVAQAHEDARGVAYRTQQRKGHVTGGAYLRRAGFGDAIPHFHHTLRSRRQQRVAHVQKAPDLRADTIQRRELRVAVDPAVQQEQALGGADVELAPEALHRQHGAVQPGVARKQGQRGCHVEAAEAVVQRQPQAMFPVLEHRQDGVVYEAFVAAQPLQQMAHAIDQQHAALQGADRQGAIGKPLRVVQLVVAQDLVRLVGPGGKAALVQHKPAPFAGADQQRPVVVGLVAPGHQCVDPFVRKTRTALDHLQLVADDLHQPATFGAHVEPVANLEEIVERGGGRPDVHMLAAQAEQLGHRAEIDPVVGDENAPHVGKIAVGRGDAVKQGDVMHAAMHIGFEIAELADAPHVHAAVGVDRQRAHGALVGHGDAAPAGAVVFQHAVIAVAHVDHAAPVLRHRPVLRCGAVIERAEVLQQRHSGLGGVFAVDGGFRFGQARAKPQRGQQGGDFHPRHAGAPCTGQGARSRANNAWRRRRVDDHSHAERDSG